MRADSLVGVGSWVGKGVSPVRLNRKSRQLGRVVLTGVALWCIEGCREVPASGRAVVSSSVATIESLTKDLETCAEVEPTAEGSDRTERLLEGPGRCRRAIYVWSPLMPLSVRGAAEIESATRRLGLPLHILDAEELYRHQEGLQEAVAPTAGGDRKDELASLLVSFGATVHFPSLILMDVDGPMGAAILGYKKAAAYHALISQRFAPVSEPVEGPARLPGIDRVVTMSSDSALRVEDVELPGAPGAYFR